MRIDKSKNDCSGCGACALKCPKKAISMQPDEMGFMYPIVDDGLCVDCGLCVKVCNFSDVLFQKYRIIHLVQQRYLK